LWVASAVLLVVVAPETIGLLVVVAPPVRTTKTSKRSRARVMEEMSTSKRSGRSAGKRKQLALTSGSGSADAEG